ncbi:MAG: leucine-rich repeat domain-containing protein [Prevotellaceae bacterium]|jgi:hypothetical protein|nr:leucine-rich repeat domain-containing protein [Prevotellaceae bacterium]
MKRLRFFLMMCVICAGTGMGSAQNVEVKFRYLHAYALDGYLSETAQYGDIAIRVERGNPTTFELESVGVGRYLIKMGTRYLFANDKKEWGTAFYTDIFDEANGYFSEEIMNRRTLLAVDAVRQDDALYVLGDEPVTDYSKLDELAQAGTVKKIDLSQVNNFVFSFSKYEIINGETAYSIISDIGVKTGINSGNGIAITQGITVSSAIGSLFFIENENNFDPGGPNYDGRFGENIHWELKDGTLTVSGTGTISDSDSQAPWALYKSSIANIVITNGITTVRMSEFFEYVNLASVTLPGSLISIGANAFERSSQLTSVTVNWTAAEDLPAMGNGVFRDISPNAILHVPPGTKAIYEAAAQWKDFKTIKEQGVTAQPTPIRNSQGGFNVSLAVPETGTFTATFDVVLPAKFRLNDIATKLTESLASRFDLRVTEKGNGVWSFGITPKAIRSASANSFREVVRVVYNVENTLEDGVYELKVKSLELKLADGTEIREDEIVIPVTFNSATGNEAPTLSGTAIRSYGRNLYITTPTAARLSVFTPEGSLQKQLAIPAGETVIALPAGVYIVKAGDTVRKISIF